jgi:polyferredoxin
MSALVEKMGYPRGLIRYATENALKRGYDPARMLRRVFRPRVLIYTGLLTAIMAVFLVGLVLRTPLKVDVIRDRGALVRETRDGRIENVYRLQIMNTDERAHRGLPGLRVTPATPVTVAAAATQSVALTVQADPADLKPGSHNIVFHVESVEQPMLRADEKSRFFARSR